MRSGASAAPAHVYVPELSAPSSTGSTGSPSPLGSTITLSPDESHYVARVCRVRPGECIDATDGRGMVARLRVESVDGDVRATVDHVETVTRVRRVWLLCGAPEGRRDDWMVEKLAELGVERWIPLDCTRARWDGLAHRRERWERLTVAALRQSRAAFRMEIGDPVAPRDVAAALPHGATRIVARPGGAATSGLSRDGLIAGAVGPAGGFDPAEVAGLDGAGFTPVGLGSVRLRTETAAIALSVAVLVG